MSVRRPLRGWKAALEIRYEVASQERSEKELKDEEIGAVRVATMVVSGSQHAYRYEAGRHTQGSQEDAHPHAAHDHDDLAPAGLLGVMLVRVMLVWGFVLVAEERRVLRGMIGVWRHCVEETRRGGGESDRDRVQLSDMQRRMRGIGRWQAIYVLVGSSRTDQRYSHTVIQPDSQGVRRVRLFPALALALAL